MRAGLAAQRRIRAWRPGRPARRPTWWRRPGTATSRHGTTWWRGISARCTPSAGAITSPATTPPTSTRWCGCGWSSTSSASATPTPSAAGSPPPPATSASGGCGPRPRAGPCWWATAGRARPGSAGHDGGGHRHRAAGLRARPAAVVGLRLPRPRCQQLLRLLMTEPRPSYDEVAAALDMPVGRHRPGPGTGLEHLRSLISSRGPPGTAERSGGRTLGRWDPGRARPHDRHRGHAADRRRRPARELRRLAVVGDPVPRRVARRRVGRVRVVGAHASSRRRWRTTRSRDATRRLGGMQTVRPRPARDAVGRRGKGRPSSRSTSRATRCGWSAGRPRARPSRSTCCGPRTAGRRSGDETGAIPVRRATPPPALPGRPRRRAVQDGVDPELTGVDRAGPLDGRVASADK